MILLFGPESIIGEELLGLIKGEGMAISAGSGTNIEDNDTLINQINQTAPEIIINCHEYGDIVNCEYERGIAYRINGEAVRNLAGICNERGIYFIHLSTSYIFDGHSSEPFSEDYLPKPLSVYGDSKLLGEMNAVETGCRCLIVRVPDVYSYRDSLLQSIMKRTRKYGRINVVRKQSLSPLSALDAARGIFELITRGIEARVHIAPSGHATALEFIKTAMDLLNGLGREPVNYQINELDYREYPIIADRPLFNVLDNSRYEKYTGIKMKGWKTSLEEYIMKYGDRI